MDIFIKSILALLFIFYIIVFLKKKIIKQNKIEFSDRLNRTIKYR